ncbi:hypothetical protein ACVWXN_009543 [Bradyrhizobium sp. i1.4.4]
MPAISSTGLEARVALDQRVDGVFEIGLGFEVDGHLGRQTLSGVMAGFDPAIHVSLTTRHV